MTRPEAGNPGSKSACVQASLRLFTTIVLVAATAATALADASTDIKNAMIAFDRLTSYHMNITGAHGTSISADFVTPGRFHTISPGSEAIVIGQTMYLKLHGAWQKLAGNMGPMQLDYTKTLASHPNDIIATDLGPRIVGGAALHAYRVTGTKTRRSDTIFLDGSGRIARIEAGATIVTISRFNVPMTIRAPI